MTVRGVTVYAKPSRGPKLLRSGLMSARSASEPSFARIIVFVAGSKFDRTLSRLPVRRRVLVAQPEIQRQPLRRAPVVLEVGEVHVAAQVGDEHAAERVLRAQAEHEVGEVVEVARRGAGAAA